MTGKVKLVLAIAAACLLLAIGWVLMGTAIWADLEPEEKRIVLEFMPRRLPLVVLLAFGGFALFSSIIIALYRAYVATPLRLVEEARFKDVDEKIAAAKASVEEERNRLAALRSELTQGVHRVQSR